MYATQASIDPSLAALLQRAQMVTPEQTPTVAAQVAQAAAQKMQPQGIAQGMPQGLNQVRQDVQAAMPSVMRNMQQAQMQQMVQQAMQPKPAGIEGLSSNIRMAEGGVVGFASRGYVDPQFPEVYETTEEDVYTERLREAAKRKQEEEERRRKLEFLETANAPQAAQYRQSQAEAARPRQSLVSPPAPPMAVEAQRLTSQQGPRGIASAPIPPVRRPQVSPTQPAQVTPAPTGIAAAIERPSIDSAVQQARAALGQDNQYETRMRGIAEREEAMRRGLPDLNARGIAALEEAFRQRQEDSQRAKFNALFEGWKGNTAAYGNFKAAERQAEQENKMAILKFQEAQQARQLGEFDRARALEKEVQGHKDKQDQILQNLASSAASMEGQLYGADVRSRDAALDREAQRKLEEYRRQTQLMRPKEQDMVSRLEALKLSEITGGKPETATPAQKLQALRSAIQDSRGTGVEERTDLNNLRLRAKIIQDELKEIMVESPRKQQLQRELDGIYRQLGGSPTGAPQGTVDKNNPLLK